MDYGSEKADQYDKPWSNWAVCLASGERLQKNYESFQNNSRSIFYENILIKCKTLGMKWKEKARKCFLKP